jgi:hypothetical protein
MQESARHATDIGEGRGVGSGDYPTAQGRRHARSGSSSLGLTLHGRAYAAADWSLGGVLIEGYEGGLTPGALLTVDEIGIEGGDMTPVAIRARVSRVDAALDHVVINFLDVDDAAYRILRDLMARRTVGLYGH